MVCDERNEWKAEQTRTDSRQDFCQWKYRMKKGLIFDMDGTLWDSAESVARSWDIAVKQCGYKRKTITEADMQSLMGITMDKIAEALFPFVEGEEREKLLQVCCEVENDYLRRNGGVLYPNLRETLTELKKDYHLYIVSNCQAGYIEAFLDYYRFWDLFEDIECYGNNGMPKGYNISLLADRNNLEKAAYVGDIQGDYDATMEAGLLFIHAAYGFGKIQQEVPAVHSLKELPEVAGRVL